MAFSVPSAAPARAPGAAVFVIAFATLLGTLMQSIVVPLLPLLPEELGASSSSVGWLVTALLVSGVVSSAVFGRLADLFGKRRMLLVCLSGLTVGSVIGATTSSIEVLIIARVLQGFAMAAMPIGIGILRDLISGERLIRGIALTSALSGIGGTLGSVVGGVVAQYLRWEWIFAGTAVCGAIAIVLVFVLIPAVPVLSGGRVDLIGAFGLAVALVAILIGISNGGHWGWGSSSTLACLLGGAAALLLWGWYETRTRHPLIDLRVLKRRPVLFTNLVTMLLGFGMYGIILATPQLAQIPTSTGYGLGASVLVAGSLSLPSVLFALLTPSFAAGLIAFRGPRTSITVGALVLVLGYVMITMWHSSIWALVLSSILVAVGLAFAYSAVPTLLLQHVERSRSAEATGVNTVFRTAGTSTNAAVVSAILTAMTLAGTTTPSEGAFVCVFLISGLSCVLVLPALAAVGRSPLRRDGA